MTSQEAWPKVSLSGVCEKPQYGAIARGAAAPLGPLFVRQTDIASGRIDWSSVPYCDLPCAEFEKYLLAPGDLLISRLGNGVGNSVTVLDDRGAVFAGYLVRFRARGSIADSSFVGYQLQSAAWRQHVASFRSGAAQPTLNPEQMGAFAFLLPPISEQRAIAATLGALDDKIESNRRAVDLAEALGDAVFIESASQARPLAEVAHLTMGSSPPGASYNLLREGLPFYQGVRDFGRRFPALRVWTTQPVRLAEAGDTLVSVRAPVGDLNRASQECSIGRGVASVRSNLSSTVYYALRAASDVWEPFQQEGTVFGAINKSDLSAAVVRWPTAAAAREVEAKLAALDRRIGSLCREIEGLEQLRDALLPELLSGRIRVSGVAE